MYVVHAERALVPKVKSCKLVVISDIHYGEDNALGARRCGLAPVLLERAVRRINLMNRPDVVLVLGDLLDDGEAPGAQDRLQELRKIIDKLNCPCLTIPGNHDGDHNRFYQVFDRPEKWLDVAGIRVVPFVDREEPGYNASRHAVDIRRVKEARAGYSGPIITAQHVCLHPVDKAVTPYNYTNATACVAALKEAGVTLSVSGHHHEGAPDVMAEGLTFVTAPGLCEAPFPLLEIVLAGDEVTTEVHNLAMPKELKLVDRHIHSELAYCSENMTVARTIELAHAFGLAGIVVTEHAGQLYYGCKPYWQKQWLTDGVEGADPASDRMGEYLKLKEAFEDDFCRFSLEVDFDRTGKGILKHEDAQHFTRLMGTVHALPHLEKDRPVTRRDQEDYLFLVDSMGKAGMEILAHPMRVFRRSGVETPEALFEPTARLLKQHGMAAEINYHTNQPPVAFVRQCLELEVPISFGSDSHHLAEIGDFAPNLALLKEAGFDGDPGDVLLS